MSESESIDTGAEGVSASPAQVLRIPIAKGGKDAFIELNLGEIPDEAYAFLLFEGAKTFLNSRMTKVGAVTKLEGKELAEANAAAMAKAAENLADLKAGKVKSKSKSAAKTDVPREVQTEAMKLGRNMVKDMIREAGGYPTQYAASEITAMAKVVLEANPEILALARENVAKRKATESKVAIDILAIGKPDPKLVEKAAKAAAEKKAKAQLSAAQAGKTTHRAGSPPPPRKSRGDVPAHPIH